MEILIKALRSTKLELTSLQRMDLVIIPLKPSFFNTPSIAGDVPTLQLRDDPASATPTRISSLTRLRLEQVPLLKIPSICLSNLRHLELVRFQLPHPWENGNKYTLRMSDLCRFLSLVPRLEDLVLVDTVPLFDVVPVDEANLEPLGAYGPRSSLITTQPVELPHLNRLEWSYPFARDFHRFLAFINAPSLETMELCPRQFIPKIHVTHDLDANHSLFYSVLHWDSLKELSVQCENTDTLGYVLRRMTFPALEKLELVNLNSQDLQGGSPPFLPRLESIFRDPRVPHLTHLTLSNFGIVPEHGKIMLGYMPALVSLSLDTCSGIGKLIESLGDETISTFLANGNPVTSSTVVGRIRRGVRFCPCLESLSLWGCSEVDFAGLCAVLKARNASTDEGRSGLCERQSGDGTLGAGEITERKIKPLRRPRHPMVVGGKRLGEQPTFPDMTFTQESLHCNGALFGPLEMPVVAHVSYLRIRDCAPITKADALTLEEFVMQDDRWID